MLQDNSPRRVTKGRILVVEDEPLIAVLIEDIVNEGGYRCIGTPTSLKSAEVHLRNVAVDAVLLDVRVRDELAYPLCEFLDEENIPFGFVSGVAQEAIAVEWKGRPYCGKPFSKSDVIEVVSALLRERQNVVHPLTWANFAK